jgi:hypothetical protein
MLSEQQRDFVVWVQSKPLRPPAVSAVLEYFRKDEDWVLRFLMELALIPAYFTPRDWMYVSYATYSAVLENKRENIGILRLIGIYVDAIYKKKK